MINRKINTFFNSTNDLTFGGHLAPESSGHVNRNIHLSEEIFKPHVEYIGYMIRNNTDRVEIKHRLVNPFSCLHFYESEHGIVPGDSGSPIVNESNELIGVMSNSNEEGVCNGTFPIITSCLGKQILEQLL